MRDKHFDHADERCSKEEKVNISMILLSKPITYQMAHKLWEFEEKRDIGESIMMMCNFVKTGIFVYLLSTA